jgi:flavin-dependent dehydrogenase
MDIISTGTAENKHIGVVRGIRFETESDDIAVSLLNNKASHNGYCYLLITNGYGCICSVNLYITGDKANIYLKKACEMINNQFEINIKNEQNVGGVGCFLLKPRLVENGKIFTGEAAGLQDLLWGFGMRYAVTSGYLAALSIIKNKNYKKLIKKRIFSRLKTSVVNRYLIDKVGDRFYNYMISLAKKDKRWIELLYKAYNPSFRSKLLYPLANWSLSRKYKRIL